MEVTNVADKVTHAVIGRGSVEEFGLSEDAELFHILSSALYSRKKEAVVREILCNAWDAHVDSGIESIPVQVTLTDEKMTFRDFGTGLSPAQIKPIYGTYGKSTKQHDGRQTGGFGLGSKAPFAYIDHFEVISHHEGMKTIYKMSQSNAEVGGKPSITTIVSVPTDDTGLQVSLNLKEPDDQREFRELIERIAEMGDMNVTLNGRPLSRIPFDSAQHGFMLIAKEEFARGLQDPIQIRYGHVIYRLNTDDRFAHLYDQAKELLVEFSKRQGYSGWRHDENIDWVLVLQADPHSISVTPSREDLSMTDKTVASVGDLLRKFIKVATGQLERVSQEMFTDAIAKTWMIGTPKDIFFRDKQVPYIDKAGIQPKTHIADFDELGRQYLLRTYPHFSGFEHKDLKMRLDALIQSGFGNRGLIQSFKAELLNSQARKRIDYSNWFHKRLVKLALRGTNESKAITVDRLYVYSKVVKITKHGSERETIDWQQVSKWSPPSMSSLLPFLRNIIVLSHTRSEIQLDRISSFPIMKYWLGPSQDLLWYAVPRNPDKAQLARDHFTKLGFHIIDLTKVQSWEHEDIVKPAVKQIYKAKKKGIVCLSAALSPLGEFMSSLLWEDEATRIEKPDFIIQMSSQTDNRNRLPDSYHMDATASGAIVRMYGTRCGVVQNKIQKQKIIDGGAMELKPWLAKQLLTEFKSRPVIEAHYRQSVAHRDDHWEFHYGDRNKIYKVCRLDTELRKKFNLVDPLPQDEKDIIAIFEDFSRWERNDHPELKEIDKLIESWSISPAADALVKKIYASKLIPILDYNDIVSALTGTGTHYTAHHKEKIREILLIALEG
jgi:hypothetical protein